MNRVEAVGGSADTRWPAISPSISSLVSTTSRTNQPAIRAASSATEPYVNQPGSAAYSASYEPYFPPLTYIEGQRLTIQLVADVEPEAHLRVGATKTNRLRAALLTVS